MPVLAVLVFYKSLCGLFGSRFVLIVDWHNYGYTILQANKVNRKLCAIAEVYEKFLGRYADFNLTVSEAFKEDLSTRFGIRRNSISVLYDRAVKGKFGPISLQEKHELFDRVGWTGMFTNSVSGKAHEKEDRPILMLTSTSYTPDEDIGILLGALNIYAGKAQSQPQLPRIHLIVTGAGP